MMNDIEVLWIDDDISTSGDEILKELRNDGDGIKLLIAKSFQESEKVLNSQNKPPSWAIVDLKVPQGTWQKGRYYFTPGIKYIERLKDEFKEDINIFVWCRIVDVTTEKKVKKAGAIDAFVKSSISFAGILNKIKDFQKNNEVL